MSISLFILSIKPYIHQNNNKKLQINYARDDLIITEQIENILPQDYIETFNKIDSIYNLHWTYYQFPEQTANGGFIQEGYDKPTIIIDESLKNDEEQRRSTLLHEYSHYLLGNHKSAPKKYNRLNINEKEIMTDITAYYIDDYFFNGTNMRGSYIRKEQRSDYPKLNKLSEDFVKKLYNNT